MSEHIIVADDGPVRTVRMNRPDKKNALTAAMYDAMAAALESASGHADIRCVVIAGVPGAFSAGNDLAEFAQAAIRRRARQRGGPLSPCAGALERPLVAAVQGLAVGVGTTMLLHCDHVVAGTDARFSTPFVGLGLVPEAASSLLAPRLMGHRRAFELLVMGRPLDAAAAQACGLVNAVVPPGDVEAEAMRAAQHIAALPAEAVAASRRLMRGLARRNRRAHRRGGAFVQGAIAVGGGANGVRRIPESQALSTNAASRFAGAKSAYSIASSASSRKSRVMVRPRAFAVFRLMTSSNLVGCCTGSSAGLAPLRILSTYTAVCRKRSGRFAP